MSAIVVLEDFDNALEELGGRQRVTGQDSREDVTEPHSPATLGRLKFRESPYMKRSTPPKKMTPPTTIRKTTALAATRTNTCEVNKDGNLSTPLTTAKISRKTGGRKTTADIFISAATPVQTAPRTQIRSPGLTAHR